MMNLKEYLQNSCVFDAIFIAKENNVINCIRDLTTTAKIGVCKANTKRILWVVNILQRKQEESTSFLLFWTHVCEVLIERRCLWEVLYMLFWYWRSMIEIISFLFRKMVSLGAIQSIKVFSLDTLLARWSAFSFRGTPRWPGTQTIFMLGTRLTVRWSLLKNHIMTFGKESKRSTKAVTKERLSIRISRGVECDTSSSSAKKIVRASAVKTELML